MILLARRRTIPAHAPLIVSVPAALNSLGTLSNGGGVQTANGGARAAFDQNGLHMYDGSNILRLFLDPVTGAMRFYDTSSRQRILIDTLTSSIHLFDASANERVLIDALNSIIKIWDPAGIARAEMGHVVVNGISPDQYGFRANDASGNPLLDNLGSISGGVMSSLGLVQVGANVNITTANNTTYSVVTGSDSTITVVGRALNVLILFYAAAHTTGTAYAGYVGCEVVGVTNSGNFIFDRAAVGDTNGFGHLFVVSLAVGTYTVRLRASTDNGNTVHIPQCYWQAFRLGS